MTYDFRAVPEASWYALGAAVGALIGAILAGFGVDAIVLAPIVAAITPLPRVLAGIFLPSPPAQQGGTPTTKPSTTP